ncbi:hypothetical protein [Rhodococcoides fascians]|uniref:hypothetical protein n=1 Tax=Rhodococcoides fascians TaxID=1828 RepID=UPI00366EB327
MSLTDTAFAGPVDPDRCLEDFRWHREFHRQAQFRWWDSEAVLVATEFTGGRDNFETITELAELERDRLVLADYAATCQRALGSALKQARTTLGQTDWKFAEDNLCLTTRTCEQSSYLASWADPFDHTWASNPQVDRVRRSCARMMFGNPLILSWELSQLWTLYDAAEMLLEDALVDLSIELSDSCSPTALLWATQMASTVGLEQRIADQRERRGSPGDDRRHPRQSFTTVR